MSQTGVLSSFYSHSDILLQLMILNILLVFQENHQEIFTLAAAIFTDEVDLSNWSEEFRIIHGASAFVC